MKQGFVLSPRVRPVKWRLAIAAVLIVLHPAQPAMAGDVDDCRNAQALIQSDPSRAIAACKRLGDQGTADAEYTLGVLYNQGLGVPRDYYAAAIWYRRAANQGHARAENNLGTCYANGWGVPQDLAEAARWYRMSAEQGHVIAEVNLGYMYENGRGVPQDYAEAVKWYRKAAGVGYPPGQFNLGLAYLNGRLLPHDDAEAARWFRKAADQGLTGAQVDLGQMYERGQGVEKDLTQAARWYRDAADRGDPLAAFNLAQMYAAGAAVPEDKVQAYKWFTISANNWGMSNINGSIEAMYLGEQLLKTMSAEQKSEAEKWFNEWKATISSSAASQPPRPPSSDADVVAEVRRLAAEGDDDAQFKLGRRFANGQGVQKDYVLADMWFSLAAARGNAMAAAYRDDLERQMTPEQIAEAKKRASEWQPTTP